MSFFKKIVDWFHDDVEDEVEVYDQEPKPQKPKDNRSKPQAEKETGIETKIQYKYPKDNFKFPLISDEEIKRLNERKKMQKAGNREAYSEYSEWTPVAPALEKRPLPKAEKPVAKAARQKAVPSTIQPNNTPFRRTEIPSPIYGFQNRATGTKRQKTVEYELSTQPTLDSVLALMKGNSPNRDVMEKETADAHHTSENDGASNKQNEEWKEERLATKEERSLIQQTNMPAYPDMPIADIRQEEKDIPVKSVAFHPGVEDQDIRESFKDEAVLKPEETAQTDNTQFELAEENDAVQFVSEEEERPLEAFGEETMHEPSETEVMYAEEAKLPEEKAAISTEWDDSELLVESSSLKVQELPSVMRLDESNDAELESNDLAVNEAIFVDEPVTEEKTASISSDIAQDAAETDEEIQLEKSEIEAVNAPVQEPDNDFGQADEQASVEPSREPKLEVITNRVEEDDERKAERAKRIQERRKHIPFNVLMLKQDKARLSGKSGEKPKQAQQEPAILADKKKLTDSDNFNYNYPDISILKPKMAAQEDSDWLAEQAELLDQTLEQFNVKAKVFAYYQGPSVTRFEVQPEPGVKVSKITNLSDDLKLSLAAKDIRIEAPIPGKRMIGIEIPNLRTRPVYLREVLEENVFVQSESPLTTAVGLDISGNPIVTDLKKMPHGLVAGSTGSGKSVFINSILVSLLYKTNPSDVRLLLIDPKMVELAPYNHIPHLAAPVITDVKAATAALKWAVEEMDRRYELFAHSGSRDIVRYNQKATEAGQLEHKLPYLVIIIDELADLMMMSPADVEEAICRIAQKARACGIHLLVATQRPSVDVITGLIKANIPTRIAFSVSSQVDSRTILDQGGAEKLLGRGDMLFLENGTSKAVRLQGTFVTDDEIEKVVEHVKEQAKPHYLFEPADLVKHADVQEEKDELYFEVCEFAVEMGGASISSIQRRFRIGYNRAARLIDIMEREGVLSEARGSKPREVLISEADLEAIQDSHLSY